MGCSWSRRYDKKSDIIELTINPGKCNSAIVVVTPCLVTNCFFFTFLITDDTSQQVSTKPSGSCVVAIDFGTSRSAFAYGFVGGGGSVTLGVPENSVISESVQLKAETTLILDENKKAVAFGLKGRRDVYTEHSDDMYLFQWFKMHLKDIANDSDESIMVSDHKGRQMPLMVIVSEALSFIAQSAVKAVCKNTNKSIEASDIHWVITVPAIWSAAASGFMRRAALRAGLIKFQLSEMLTLVREPEAACVDLLDDIEKCDNPVNLNNGDEMLILDCGGGTNDMAFVKILSKQPLQCQELKSAAGGTAGAASIDRHLRKLLEDLLGRSRYDVLKTLTAMVDLFDNWEQFKVSFEGNGSYTCDLSTLMDEHHELDSSADAIDNAAFASMVAAYNQAHLADQVNVRFRRIVVPTAVLVKWFDSVVDVVINDLREQLAAPQCRTISMVYLVGGFCSNKYLVEKVTKYLNANHPKIAIIAAKLSDVAIARGAAIAGIRSTALVSDHVVDYAYGVRAIHLFDKRKHDFSKSTIAADGQRRVEVLVMYVAKGQHVPIDYVTPPHLFCPLTEAQDKLCLDLYTAGDPSITRDSVVYISDSSVRKVASVAVPVNKSVPFAQRLVNVSVKFGLETQILARDQNNQTLEGATCQFFRA
jgi:molecular chaperone DnaK (HSP70)